MNNKLYWLSLLLIFFVILILNYYTPLAGDDYAYAFYYASDSRLVRPTSVPISWNTLIQSMWHHYLCVNGRFTNHILFQIFSGLIGKTIFNIINSLVFVWMIHLLVSLSSKRYSFLILWVTIVSVFIFAPYPGQTILWMAGALNYLWPMTFALAIMYFIENNRTESTNAFHLILLFLAGLVTGMMQESITIGLSGGLVIWFLFNKNHFRGPNVALSLGLWIGTLLLVVSPGSHSRLNEVAQTTTFLQMISSRLLKVSQALIHHIPIWFAIILIAFNAKKKELLKFLLLPISTMLITLLFICVLGLCDDRIFFGLTIFALLLIIRYFCNFNFRCNLYVRYGIIYSLIILYSFLAIKAYASVKNNYEYRHTLVENIKASSNDVIIEVNNNKDSSKWVMRQNYSADPYDFHNRVMAFYYEKESIRILDAKVYKAIMTTPIDSIAVATDLSANYRGVSYPVYDLPGLDLWMINIPKMENPEWRTEVIYILNNEHIKLSWIQYFKYYLLDSLPSDSISIKSSFIENRNKSYILFSPVSSVKDIFIKELPH